MDDRFDLFSDEQKASAIKVQQMELELLQYTNYIDNVRFKTVGNLKIYLEKEDYLNIKMLNFMFMDSDSELYIESLYQVVTKKLFIYYPSFSFPQYVGIYNSWKSGNKDIYALVYEEITEDSIKEKYRVMIRAL